MLSRSQTENGATRIPDDLISLLSELVKSHAGLHFPREKWSDLKRGISAAASDLGFDDTEACIKWLLSGRATDEQRQVLVGHLTVGETFFFRDKPVFQAIREHILPEWRGSGPGTKGGITFWSAACCTGEEPYSIAILIDQMPEFRQRRVKIIATDINPGFLGKARNGIYSRWSLRDAPDEILKRYFKKTGANSFEISPDIKRMVDFSLHNLVEGGSHPPGLGHGPEDAGKADIIFCRNVLMYLSPEMREETITRLRGYLRKGGWMILSPSEIPLVKAPDLNPVRFSGATLFQKGPRREKGPRAFGAVKALKTPLPGPVPPLRAAPCGKLQKTGRHGEERDLFGEALTLYSGGLYNEAAERLNRLLSNGSGNKAPAVPEQMALLAKVHANLGRLGDARTWCERAIEADKLNPEYHFLMAAIYQEEGLVEESIKSLRQAIYLDPDLVMAHYLLGHLERGQGKNGRSDKHFRNALDLLTSMNPDDIVPLSDGITAEGIMETIRLMVEDSNQG